ncbi:hypothetical protein [Streptomyces sp. NRRL WC-3742]|uniref:hypothetical protein n=1 Tax=Streptomyces sp. NRRL WC-3742 TaxID=1463934 RepID=UPI0004CB3ADB|nr:hypothetical protein [Streptomyces sp. NRRL WC-3742]
MGAYDPTYLIRDAAKSVHTVAEDLVTGRAEWDRPRDLARALESLQQLMDDLSRVLIQQAGLLPRMTRDSDAPKAGQQIAEAAATAAQLSNQLRRAQDATDGVR